MGTYVVTWDLWNPRATGPTATQPLIPMLGAVPFAGVLVLTAGAGIWWPRAASAIHTVLLGAAIGGDLLRLQPEVMSLGLLLGLTAQSWSFWAVRWHLAALWFWAGFHKAMSGGWARGSAATIAGELGISGMGALIAVAVPLVEMAIGTAVLSRRLRPAVGVAGAILHIGITLVLHTLGNNIAVVPWNLALIVLALAAVPHWDSEDRAVTPWVPKVLAAASLISPAGLYVGVTHPYLAWSLYSDLGPHAEQCHDGRCEPFGYEVRQGLHVPIPPSPFLFEAIFRDQCESGDTLRVTGLHTRLGDPDIATITC